MEHNSPERNCNTSACLRPSVIPKRCSDDNRCGVSKIDRRKHCYPKSPKKRFAGSSSLSACRPTSPHKCCSTDCKIPKPFVEHCWKPFNSLRHRLEKRSPAALKLKRFRPRFSPTCADAIPLVPLGQLVDRRMPGSQRQDAVFGRPIPRDDLRIRDGDQPVGLIVSHWQPTNVKSAGHPPRASTNPLRRPPNRDRPRSHPSDRAPSLRRLHSRRRLPPSSRSARPIERSVLSVVLRNSTVGQRGRNTSKR